MALGFLKDIGKAILGGIGGGIVNAFKSDPIGSFGGLVQTGLGTYSALNPPELYPPELIEEMIAASREGRQLSGEAFEVAKAASEMDRQITGARLQGLGRSQELLASSLDPESAVFRKQLAGETGRIKRSFVDALNEYRNYMNRYGSGIINPSRRDETVARVATRGFEDAQAKARENVRNYLMATAAENRAVAATYGGSSGGGVSYQPPGMSGFAGALQGIAGNRQAAQESRETGFGNIVGGLNRIGQRPEETARPLSGYVGAHQRHNWPGQDHNHPLMV